MKAGYKPTEVGVIPEDWECSNVRKVADLLTGFPFPSAKYSGSGIRLLRGSNIKRGVTDWSIEITKYWPELNSELSQYQLRESDVVISMDGSLVGRSFAQIKNKDLPALLLQRVARLRAKAIDTNYLKEWVCSIFFTAHCDLRKTVTAIPHISPEDIYSFLIPLPPTLEEQRKIAGALSDMDELISSLEKLIEKKKAIKQGAMQELLTGKTRLPGFTQKPGYKPTEVGVIPEDWMLQTVIDTTDKNVKWSFTGGPFGSDLKSSDYTDLGVRVIQLQNIGDGVFLDESHVYISKDKADQLIACNIYPGDIIFSKMGDPVARACIVPYCNSRYLMCSDGIRYVVDKSKYEPKYIFSVLNFDIFREQAINSSTGSTRRRIGLTELKNLRLPLPPTLKEQQAIARVLSDVDEEIQQLQSKVNKYRKLKQGMMQELLTGKTRLV